MGAWRKPSTQRSIVPGGRKIYETGFDDDGEKFGGKRLEKLLEDMQVEGAVVVARWYGGVMLGPVRFTHIESCGRVAIRECMSNGEEGVKRVKTESEAKVVDRKKLEQVLTARDASITVLRGLLAEKLAAATSGNDEKKVSSSPAKTPNYSNIPVGALERLEKARDATLAWLLQEIDKAELKVKEANESRERETKPYETKAVNIAEAKTSSEETQKQDTETTSLEFNAKAIDAPASTNLVAVKETTDISQDLPVIPKVDELLPT